MKILLIDEGAGSSLLRDFIEREEGVDSIDRLFLPAKSYLSFSKDCSLSPSSLDGKPEYKIKPKLIFFGETGKTPFCSKNKRLINRFTNDQSIEPSQESIKELLRTTISDYDEIYIAVKDDVVNQAMMFNFMELIGLPFFAKNIYHIPIYSGKGDSYLFRDMSIRQAIKLVKQQNSSVINHIETLVKEGCSILSDRYKSNLHSV
jgi:hypothetical protein